MQSRRIIFNLKGIVILLVSLLIVFSAVAAGVLLKQKLDHDKLVRVQKQRQAQLDSFSKEQKAVNKAEAHLMDSITLVKPAERLFLDYLQRKFDLDNKLGVAGPPFDLSEDPRTYPQEIHYLARIAYPNRLVNVSPVSRLEGIQLANASSANCDHLQLSNTYWQTIEQDVITGGYYLTHVALALAFMKDNACTLPVQANTITQTVIRGMVTLADDPKTNADLRYEAIAFLMLSDRHDLVQSSWIDQIIAEQTKDGDWGPEVAGGKPDTHATILAFWALLEYSRPNTPNEPIILRPNQ